jgi:uncharacterized RDD family membrane protein YckC
MAITCLLLMILSMTLIEGVPFYKNANETINNLQTSSHLYIKTDDKLELMCDHYDVLEESDFTKYNKMFDEALTLFYKDPLFFDQNDPKSGIYLYNTQKIPEGQNYSELFLYSDSTRTEIVQNPNVEASKFYEFYVNAMSGPAISYLVNNADYYEASKTISLTFIFINFAIPLILSTTIFELIIPLILSRGKKTLGKLVFKLSVVDVQGLSCSYKRYICRFLIFLFIETILNVVAILIPLIVSFSMFVFSKTGQSFHDYLANTYVIEAAGNSVCKTKEEYLKKYAHDQTFELDKDDVVL